jgi:ribosomal protein S18 acetylase RimI-like enzyme
LAILPAAQGQGVGAQLLSDMVMRFTRRGFRSFTVNTQETNERSQRLYQRFGFVRNGYDLPVWFIHL